MSAPMLEWLKVEYPLHSATRLDMGKSCIRFKRLEEEDVDLLERIIMYVGTTYTGEAPKLKMFAKA